MWIIVLLVIIAFLLKCMNSDKYIYGHGEKTKRMFVQSPWLEEIAEGKKTTEGRVGPNGKYQDWVGKEVIFFNHDLEVLAKVIKVVHYDNLESYLDGEGWDKCAPHLNSKDDAVKAYQAIMMDGGKTQVFSEERISKEGGINAIKLELR